MLTKKQVKEIKEHLAKAQNPIFFFDNDTDGLCSFLLLQRYLGRGKGVIVKSYPDMDENYFRRVDELEADYIFILDKPVVSESFFKKAEEEEVPVVWIDHHDIQVKIPKSVNVYNVTLNKQKTNEPVTALCYQITERKEDLWLAVAGCISDKFVPDFYKEFTEKYPELSLNSKNAFDILYKSEIGKVAHMLNFGLKDSITNVVAMQKFLMKAKSPYDVLEEGNSNRNLHKKFNHGHVKYQRLLEKAKKIGEEESEVLFFSYGGEISMSGDLSNELSYIFPEKFIVVIYSMTPEKANISIRGNKAREILLKAIEGMENARGGGHETAVGGQIQAKDISEFKKKIFELVNKA